jgi:hypothetical protein
MALQPGASLQSKWDATRSYFQRREEFGLVATAILAEEGQLATKAGVGSVLVDATTGLATDVPAGVMLLGEIDANTFAWVENSVVPAALTYTLKFNNLAAAPYSAFIDTSDIYMWNTTSGAPIIRQNPVSATYSCNGVTGVLTFAAGLLAIPFTVRYRWTLTANQSREIVRQSAIGRGSEGTYRKVMLGRGNNCRIFTTQFNEDSIWTLNLQNGAGNSPCCGAAGLWSTVTNIGTGIPFGRVISLPSLTDPYIGFEYTTP